MTDIPRVGIGLLGYAFMGKAHSNALKTLSYMLQSPPALPRLVAIAGRDQAAVKAAAQRYGWERATTDWRDIIADPDVQVFDNGGPNDVHAEASIAAARAGKHVICEKPLARTAAEAKTMLEAVTQAGVKHMAAFNYRFVPAARLAYELVKAGELGTIYHFRARYLQDWLSNPAAPHTWRLTGESAGSGALGDLGSHVVDLARFLIGEPQALNARLRTFTTQRPTREGGTAEVTVDDAFAATVEFDSGAMGTLEASRVANGRKNHFAWEINGSRASIAFDMQRLNELRIYRPSAGGFASVLVTESDHPFMRNWWPTGHILGWEHTFVHEIAHFLDAVVNDGAVGPYGATFQDGYRAAVVCDAIALSDRERREVRVSELA